jgi:hypothetical protein
MAVVQRYYGLNYGETAKDGAGQQPVTSGVASTSKDIEVRIDLGDPAGSTSEQAHAAMARDKSLVVSQLRRLTNEIENTPWPPARS